MARVPEMAGGKISLARGIHCAILLFILPHQLPYIMNNMCVCIYIYMHKHI